MLIAFASNDGEKINEHFGWCKNFFIYKVDKDKNEFVEKVEFVSEPDEEREKLLFKFGKLKECDLLYCIQIGPGASKIANSFNIFPVKVDKNESIKDAIEKIQNMLKNNPPIWLLRIYKRSQNGGNDY
ncbi:MULTISPECIES: NifB/NifX family molybdenum-iron cluster-binding protein [unclassified Lebetimonas]|jgi:nitrogen fixation protein NifX|uniref:NifB/NifX family molybdenum-iron cluster-binding protein n=1 Tax=unclassified Lebetimonas TaxID=2648158 RepID=UPI00046556E8|nr:MULTISPECIES: NifB/NifX family molybdenum-iron cluster-binding protein [unclassified Lebetimonas]